MNTNDKMTLREALELALRAHDPYAGMAHYKARDRARDILLAAVEAHEARCELDDYDGSDRPERLLRVEACFDALAKLRALERGKQESS